MERWRGGTQRCDPGRQRQAARQPRHPHSPAHTWNRAPLQVRDLLRNPQHNSVMMAYGITAAGKTYTIEGTAAAPGVMPRALGALFEGLADHVEAVSVRVAYYEVCLFCGQLGGGGPIGDSLHRLCSKNGHWMAPCGALGGGVCWQEGCGAAGTLRVGSLCSLWCSTDPSMGQLACGGWWLQAAARCCCKRSPHPISAAPLLPHPHWPHLT